jgi:hypothetical protein
MAYLCVDIAKAEQKHVCSILFVWVLCNFPLPWRTMFATRDFICLVAVVSARILSAKEKTIFEPCQILVRGHANKNPEIQRWRNMEWVAARKGCDEQTSFNAEKIVKGKVVPVLN